ncbi:juvenile hormone acid O-methyltransferase-like isoform X1 [Coccinella septempunctata]|uniref:juvenile hormone acid O-methyltransferase-like isoform X1 n=1 Tax=Coccinella septempunctata TaxID=41139 RepID=UPI001D078B55|nr:juvenile hormone acid O-methyltransferase-like isoform X1 [Coccinella septempunctata]
MKMATHVLKYSKFAIYHLSCIEKIYKTYFNKLNIPKNGSLSVMDIGCGSGSILFDILHPLLPKNCNEIIATDIDECMIKYCEKINKEKNISFLQMDIATNELSEALENRFDAIFSSFCFMYVTNIRRGLMNCRRMLKTNSDILLVFISKKNPLYSTYAEMNRCEIWKPYTENFKDFVPHFSSDDPDSEVNSLFEDVNLQLVNKEFHHNLRFESNRRNFLEVFNSMDTVFRTIPVEKRSLYLTHFQKIFSDVSGLNVADEGSLDQPASMNIPIAILHGRKL